MARLVFGRENERNFKMITELRRRKYLLKREIFDAYDLHGTRDISKIRARQFVAGVP